MAGVRFLSFVLPLTLLAFLVYYYATNYSVVITMERGTDTPQKNPVISSQGNKANDVVKVPQNIPEKQNVNNSPESVTVTSDHKTVKDPGEKNDTHDTKSEKQLQIKFSSYQEALKNRASSKKLIYLAYIDLGAMSSAVNFYITSFEKHRISNLLFLASSSSVCTNLHSLNIPCFQYVNDTAWNKESTYMSRDFIRKMNIRTFMILEALKLGYNVIHTDVDMYFFKDPAPVIEEQCKDCDIAPLWDCGAYNAGFLFIRNSSSSIAVYDRMNHTAHHSGTDDQTALNGAMNAVRKKQGLKLKRLPDKQFQCGMRFFEMEHRTFVGDNPCSYCVVVHNNWIVTIEAKIYRFKEMHMWMYDEDKYYSDPNRKYLTYNNPTTYPAGEDIWNNEKEALINALALGQILNRVVILPRNLCNNKLSCTLLRYIKLIHFDKQFPNKYRETTFLTHPLVPKQVTESKSEVHLIKTKGLAPELQKTNPEGVSKTLIPADETAGATSDEIIKWFGKDTHSVLQFHSLNKAFSKFSDSQQEQDFRNRVGNAFKKTKPRQFKK